MAAAGEPAPKRVGKEAPEDTRLSLETRGMFETFARHLTAKHDRHERLVKISRDVTIASKRIIFLLHRVTHDGLDCVLSEVTDKFTVVRSLIGSIAVELKGLDAQQFSRAFSPGIQEYVEAATFFSFITLGRLISCAELNTAFSGDQPSFVICPSDYVLGVADLTGELMRKCIACMGVDNDALNAMCAFVRGIYSDFMLLNQSTNVHELGKKTAVMKQSLQKIEDACYMMKVRGAEFSAERLRESLVEFSAVGDGVVAGDD